MEIKEIADKIADQLFDDPMALRGAVMVINDVLTAELPRWIPVSERLPNEGEYLVLIHGSKIRTAKYRHNLWAIPYHEHASATVTHWQPLPDPMEGE